MASGLRVVHLPLAHLSPGITQKLTRPVPERCLQKPITYFRNSQERKQLLSLQMGDCPSSQLSLPVLQPQCNIPSFPELESSSLGLGLHLPNSGAPLRWLCSWRILTLQTPSNAVEPLLNWFLKYHHLGECGPAVEQLCHFGTERQRCSRSVIKQDEEEPLGQDTHQESCSRARRSVSSAPWPGFSLSFQFYYKYTHIKLSTTLLLYNTV